MSSYVFMAFSGNGDLSGVETLFDADDEAAGRAAPAFLPHDDVGGRVEIWRDAELVSTVGVAPGHDWGV